MNWIDLVLAVLIMLSIAAGLRAGFVRTAIGLVSTILGLVFGLHYYLAVAVSLRPYISQAPAAKIAGFLIVFCGITLLGAVAAGILTHFIRSVDLAWLDHTLGGAFGVVRGLLFCTIVIWGLMAFLPVPPRLALSGSRLAPCVMDAARRVADASPDEVQRTFRRSYRELKRVLPEPMKDRLADTPAGQF
jgi:membrane protein required for colicin V production